MDDNFTLKTQRGASLVEISITVVIISITALIILSFSRSTTSMSKDARGSDSAYLSAEKKLVELSKMAYPVAGSDVDTIDNQPVQRSWTVKDTNYIKCAIVTVTYPTLRGTSRSITLAGAVN